MARCFPLAAALVVVGWAGAAPALQNELMPETTVTRHGLVRPWFAQVELDLARTRLKHVVLYEGVLYAQSNTANVHAIDAETGRTLWSKQIGSPNHPSMPPDARGDFLAVVNGSRLYVVNRFNGTLLYEKEIRDAPGGGPALSSKRAYVPSVTGLIVAYQVEAAEEPAKAGDNAESALTTAGKVPAKTPADKSVRLSKKFVPPLFCQSFGRTPVQPLVTRDDLSAEYVVWPTDKGFVNFGRIGHEGNLTLSVKYRLETGATIVARPAYLPPNPKVIGDGGVVFAASCDGFVYAIQEETGETLWRFSAGEAIIESPAVIGDHVYVTTQLGGMHCLETSTGKPLWWSESVLRFVAASKSRVYATDSMGRLLVLNSVNGARLDAIPMPGVSTIIANADTDRLYLISNGGLIQCLHEAEQTEPFVHNKERKDAAKAGLVPPPAPKKEASEEKPKKEHVAPKPPPVPKDKPKKEIKPKEPKTPTPRRPGRGAGKGQGPNAGGNQGGNQGDPFAPGNGAPPANGNGNMVPKNNGGNNPF